MRRTPQYLIQRRKEYGSVLGIAAVGMVAILLAVGLCVDVGHWYLVAGELQNAADAAALAATSSLDATAGGITQAVDRAVATVNKYEFNGTNATIERTDVRFATQLSTFDAGTGLSETDAKASPANIRFVKVTVPPKSIGVFFASIATNSSTINLSRSAVAGLSVDLNSFGNIVPLALVEDSSTGFQFISGGQYTVSVNNGSKLPVGGEYLILDLTSSRGSNTDLRELLAIGSDGNVTSGQTIPVRTGNKSGQISGGIDTRFDDYSGGLDSVSFPPDANIREGITRAQYRELITAPSHPGVWDRRILVLPIITPSQYNAGTNTITPTKFGAFFMTSKVGGGQPDLHLEYIGTPAVIGNGGYDPTGGVGTPNVTTAVLYR